MAVHIVSDAACGLGREIVRRFNIHIVPIVVRLGDRELLPEEMEAERFWTQIGKNLRNLHTSATSPGVVRQIIKPLVETGHQVLCITLTSHHSSTYDVFKLSTAEFGERVTIFDSQSFSLGQGLLVLLGAKMAQQGLSLEEIVARLTDLRRRLRLYILLNSVEQVKRGGRLSRVMVFIDRAAKVFDIKPILTMEKGEFRFHSVVRSFRQGVRRLSELALSHAPIDHMAIAYTQGEEDAHYLSELMRQKLSALPADLLFADAGPIFAAHAGRRGLGIMIIEHR